MTTFTWTIEDWKNRPEKFDEELLSASFTATGPDDILSTWQLKLYPKGDRDDARDSVSVYLISLNSFSNKAKYNLYIIKRGNQKTGRNRFVPYEFPPYDGNEDNRWGTRNFVEIQTFQNNLELLPDGNLTLFCELTVMGPEKILTGSKYPEEKVVPRGNCLQQISDHWH